MRTLARFLSRGLILLAILVPVQALAQTGAASLTGIVTDQSGAVVPGATVTATNQATNVEYTAISNDAGNYNVTSLPVGAYVVKAELSRFKTASTKPIQMEAKQVVRLDFKLELGGLAETVEVTSTSPVLQTESTTVGQVISGTTLNNLPLNGRNTGQLVADPAGGRHAESKHLHQHPQFWWRPPVREREPRADQQLHDRRRGHERVDRQPRGVPAES